MNNWGRLDAFTALGGQLLPQPATVRLTAREHVLYGGERLDRVLYASGDYAVFFNAVTEHWVAPGEHFSVIPTGQTPPSPTAPAHYPHVLGQKRFELSNHLGNVQATVSDKRVVTSTESLADIHSLQDYYPFGMRMPGRTASLYFNNTNPGQPVVELIRDDYARAANLASPGSYAQLEAYRFGFNGMESDPEWKGEGNSYTTHFRILDVRLGRWLSIDPEATSFPGTSPYSSMANNPVLLQDPDGDVPWLWIDAVADVGFALYDVGDITYQYVSTGTVDPVSVSALVADATAIAVPMATGAGLAVRAAGKAGKLGKTGVKAGEVGRFNKLKNKELPGDGLDIHHVPQKGPAEKLIKGYDKKTGPSIAIPNDPTHLRINRMQKGDNNFSNARELLARDIRHLRKEGVSNEPLVKLIKENKAAYPEMRKPITTQNSMVGGSIVGGAVVAGSSGTGSTGGNSGGQSNLSLDSLPDYRDYSRVEYSAPSDNTRVGGY